MIVVGIMLLVIAGAIGASVALVASPFRRLQDHRPRLLELVDAPKQLPAPRTWKEAYDCGDSDFQGNCTRCGEKWTDDHPRVSHFKLSSLDVIVHDRDEDEYITSRSMTAHERAMREWKRGPVAPGHAPSANDYARAVGTSVPGAGVRRKG